MKAEKGNPLYPKSLYKELMGKLKNCTKWLENHPMENPDVYQTKEADIRQEYSFLYKLGELPDL